MEREPDSRTPLVSKPANKRSPAWVLRLTGFEHLHNVGAWLVLGGALMAFCLARLPMVDIDGFYQANGGIGEYFYFKQKLYRVCTILAVFQFVPIIRHKAILIHRINGYAVFLLYIQGSVGGIVITRHAYGGHISTQTAAGALAILVLLAFAIGWVQIKRLQIDQHRRWMIRALSMMASIVTSRIILVMAAAIVNRIDGYYEIWPCDQLEFTVNDPQRFARVYPECSQSTVTKVKARNGYPEQDGSGHRLTFGMTLWLAVAVHIILAEFYIHFAPGESQRLRQISDQQQSDLRQSDQRQSAPGVRSPRFTGIPGGVFSRHQGKPSAHDDGDYSDYDAEEP